MNVRNGVDSARVQHAVSRKGKNESVAHPKAAERNKMWSILHVKSAHDRRTGDETTVTAFR